MEREARRKKIKSRETDRMALITGRIQALDPNIAKSSSFSHNPEDHLPDLAKHSRSSSEPAPLDNDDGLFPHCVGELADAPHDDEQYVSKQNETKMSRKEAAASSSAPVSYRRSTSALVKSRASHDAELPRKPFEYRLNSITARDINFSVISSENKRAVSSLVIAVLVVLSQTSLPHKLVKSKSLIDYRPLYAVLLSDLLIVSATLALFSQGKEDEKEKKLEADVNWDGAVKLLEGGLILYQTIRAIFIDFSVYLVIVVCGLSLMHI